MGKYVVNSKTYTSVVLADGNVRAIPITILSSTVDAGNTTTTTLRSGLPMAKYTSGVNSGKWGLHDNSASNGLEDFIGILADNANMLDAEGTATDTSSSAIVTGEVNEDVITAIATTDGGAPAWDKASAKTDNLGLIWRTPASVYFPGARAI